MRLAASDPKSVAVQVDAVVNDDSLSRADEKFNRLVDKGVQAAKDGNVELTNIVDKALQKYTGMRGGARIKTTIETVVDDNGNKHFKSMYRVVGRNLGRLLKMKNINANSVTSLRQQVNTLKQQRDILNPVVDKVDAMGNAYEAINPKIQELNEKIVQKNKLLQKALGVQEGSVSAVQREISLLEKQRDILSPVVEKVDALGNAYKTINPKVKELNEEIAQKSTLLQKALGIQQGSISAIQREIDLLEEKRAKMAAIASVPAPKDGTAVVQVMNPEMKEVTAELEKQQALLRQAQGIQKGSVADLEAEIDLLKEKARVTQQTYTYVDQYGNRVTEAVDMNKEDKKVLEEKEAQLRKVKGIQEGSKAALQEQLAIAIKQRDNTSRLVKVTDRHGKVIGTKVNPQWKVSNKNVTLLENKINKLGASTGGLGGKLGGFVMGLGQLQMAMQGILAVQQLVNAAVGAFVARQKQIQALKLTFDGIGVGLEGQEAILKSASAVALTYGQSLSKVESAYKRLGPAIQQSGGSLEDTQLAIETIAARTTQLGLNTEQTGRYIEAFAQVLGKGKLQGEELNQQFAELDGALRGQLQSFIEAEYGIADFNQAMKDGEITSQMFLDSMIAIGEEARGKIAQDIGKISESIAKIGEEGGPTIQQLQNQLETLSTIGLQEVGKTLGEFGKSLMAIQAAFVQVFTKIATEMPGIQKVFKATFGAIGTFLELAINGLILLFGVMMREIDKFYSWLDSIPLVRNLFKGMAEGSDKLKDDLRLAIDGFSKLDEATTGTLRVIKQYENELGILREELDSGNLTLEERVRKQEEYDELLAKKTAAEAAAREKQLSDQYASTREVLATLIEKKKEQLAVEEKIAKEKIEAIKEVDQKEKEAYNKQVELIKKRGDADRESLDARIEATKAFYAKEKQLIDESIRAQRAYGQEMKDKFSGAIAAVEQYYAILKQAEESRHQEAISNLDAEISKVKEKYASEISSLSSGPQQDKLQFMELSRLRKEARTAETAYERQRARAQIESIQNARRKADLEKQQAEELKKLEKEKAEEEKRNAEEKKRLEEEEKARKEALAAQDRQIQKDILVALEALAGTKRKLSEEEKAKVKELKDAKKASHKSEKDQIEELKKLRDKNHERRVKQMDIIKEKIKKERKAVEDVENALSELPAEAGKLGEAVDAVTTGALQRQLNKVLEIKRELGKIKSGGGGGGGGGNNSPKKSFASGGPVTGGTEYMVNELGREGFVSSSGKISEITAPAFGTWKAPAMGTIIPAHIWKQYKETKRAVNPNTPPAHAPGSDLENTSDAMDRTQSQGAIQEILQGTHTILTTETRGEQGGDKKKPRFKMPALKYSGKDTVTEKSLEDHKEKEVKKQEELYRKEEESLENYKEKEVKKQEEFYRREESEASTPTPDFSKATSDDAELPALTLEPFKTLSGDTKAPSLISRVSKLPSETIETPAPDLESPKVSVDNTEIPAPVLEPLEIPAPVLEPLEISSGNIETPVPTLESPKISSSNIEIPAPDLESPKISSGNVEAPAPILEPLEISSGNIEIPAPALESMQPSPGGTGTPTPPSGSPQAASGSAEIPTLVWEQEKEGSKAMKLEFPSAFVPDPSSDTVSDFLSSVQDQGTIKEVLQSNNTILPVETNEEPKTDKKQPRSKLPNLKDSTKNKTIEKHLKIYKEKEIKRQEDFYKEKEREIRTPIFDSMKVPADSTKIPAYVWSEVKQPRRSRGMLSPKGSVGVSSSSTTNVNNINKTKNANSSSSTVYNNNVTIQSVNPNQDAQRMVVELNRLRANRYS